MGWTPVNEVTVERDFDTRLILVRWKDEMLGHKQETFPFEQEKEAFEFALKTFSERCM